MCYFRRKTAGMKAIPHTETSPKRKVRKDENGRKTENGRKAEDGGKPKGRRRRKIIPSSIDPLF
jgi:hypothetical protein